MKEKPSELFEGENSNLKKTFDETVTKEETIVEKYVRQMSENHAKKNRRECLASRKTKTKMDAKFSLQGSNKRID